MRSSRLRLKRRAQMPRPVDERVAVHRAEARECGVLEAGDHLDDALLLRHFHLRLEADDVEVIVGEVFLAQLHDRVRPLAGARMFEADRLHRTEAQRVDAARRDLLDRQAAFEVRRLLEVVQRKSSADSSAATNASYSSLRHRRVEVVGGRSLCRSAISSTASRGRASRRRGSARWRRRNTDRRARGSR